MLNIEKAKHSDVLSFMCCQHIYSQITMNIVSVYFKKYLYFSVFQESSDLSFKSIYSKKVNYNRSYLPLKWPVV